jgi:hypothetical protein
MVRETVKSLDITFSKLMQIEVHLATGQVLYYMCINDWNLLFLVLQLHHMDRSPYAAIASITCLWHRVPKELHSEQPIGLIPGEKCQVWVWVHAVAFDETFLCL